MVFSSKGEVSRRVSPFQVFFKNALIAGSAASPFQGFQIIARHPRVYTLGFAASPLRGSIGW